VRREASNTVKVRLATRRRRRRRRREVESKILNGTSNSLSR